MQAYGSTLRVLYAFLNDSNLRHKMVVVFEVMYDHMQLSKMSIKP